MSTGLSCIIQQVSRNAWFYILEDWDAPKQAWDWREYASAFGPFVTQQAAEEHLERFQSNPGGHHVKALPAGVDSLHYSEPNHKDYDKVLLGLISKAPENTKRFRRF